MLKAKLKWIRNVLILKITIKALKHSFFKSFTKIGRSDIGSCLQPFLKTAVACVNLLLGKMPQRRESLIMDDRNGGIGYSTDQWICYCRLEICINQPQLK